MAEEQERVSELVIGIFRSVTWILPVAQFVDENCNIFEIQEENKLEYTLVHNAFKQLVEDLLTIHLTELNLSTEQFTQFCQQGLTGSNELQRSLVEQIISVDDFLVFKAMMVKRNSELSREALQPIAATYVIATDPVIADENQPPPPPPPAEEVSQGQAEETDVERLERLEAEQRCVEAELQLAIALSKHLEKRLQLIEALNEVLEMAAQISAHAESMQMEAEAEAAIQAAQQAVLMIQQQQEACGLPAMVHLQPMQLAGNEAEAFEDPCAAEQRKAEAALQQQQAELRVAEASAARKNAEQRTASAHAGQGPTEEERAARAEHLKRQREALMEKKRREREAELASFRELNSDSASARAAERACHGQPPQSPQADAGRRLAAELRGEVSSQAEATSAEEAQKAKALEMRRALSRQLKQTLTMSMQ
eukprot:TRINITY_DN10843_c0_g1_i2.p1 TRINITY_DN10843_c0_g1~~TRINITY_DN10843_c0_g1_i2.p1  ORF type:complete len:468 (-),score=152.74 TRINITY_DN10843_c0_g1_i2:139-1413(-)